MSRSSETWQDPSGTRFWVVHSVLKLQQHPQLSTTHKICIQARTTSVEPSIARLTVKLRPFNQIQRRQKGSANYWNMHATHREWESGEDYNELRQWSLPFHYQDVGVEVSCTLPYCHRKLRVRHAKVIQKQFTFSSCQGLRLLVLLLGFVVFEIARIWLRYWNWLWLHYYNAFLGMRRAVGRLCVFVLRNSIINGPQLRLREFSVPHRWLGLWI